MMASVRGESLAAGFVPLGPMGRWFLQQQTDDHRHDQEQQHRAFRDQGQGRRQAWMATRPFQGTFAPGWLEHVAQRQVVQLAVKVFLESGGRRITAFRFRFQAVADDGSDGGRNVFGGG